MSRASVIERLANGTFTLTRQVASSYDANGRLVDEGATTEIELVASVQPLSGDDLAQLAEGQVASERRVVYATEEMQTRTPEHDPDTIEIDGSAWEVVNVERWDALGVSHWKAIVARVAG